MTVKGWVDSVISKKRMFVDVLDSKIEERKAKIARLDRHFLDLQEHLEDAK